MNASNDPGQAYERHYMARQDALRWAAEAKAKGWKYIAQLERRKAAGHKGAMTRIEKNEGWR